MSIRDLVKGFVCITVTIIATTSLLTHAASGELDTSFGPSSTGWVTTPISTNSSHPHDYAFAVGRQSDGRIVVAGYTQRGTGGAPNLRKIALARYTSSGDLDVTFGIGGIVTTIVGGIDNAAQSMAIQPDDKIVVAGFAEVTSFGYDFSLARYNADGSPDGSFGSSGIVNTVFAPHTFPISSHAHAVLILNDNKILAAGNATLSGGDPQFALARYLTNGALDTAFGTGGKTTANVNPQVAPPFESIEEIAIQPDGKIVVAGYTGDGADTYDFAVSRFGADGSLDAGFGNLGTLALEPGASSSQALSVAIQSIAGQARILVAGYSDNGSYNDITLVRLLPDGTLDASFGTGGIVKTDVGAASIAAAVIVDAGGRIIVAGSTAGNFALVAYTPQGVVDPTFGSGGIVTTDLGLAEGDTARGLVLQPDGKIVVAGYADRSTSGIDLDLAVARYEGLQQAVEVPALSPGLLALLVIITLAATGYAAFRRRRGQVSF